MTDPDLIRRLDAQDRLLDAILAALAPPPGTEESSSGFDDLVEALADLTEAVADVTDAVKSLRSTG